MKLSQRSHRLRNSTSWMQDRPPSVSGLLVGECLDDPCSLVVVFLRVRVSPQLWRSAGTDVVDLGGNPSGSKHRSASSILSLPDCKLVVLSISLLAPTNGIIFPPKPISSFSKLCLIERLNLLHLHGCVLFARCFRSGNRLAYG